MLLAEVNMEGLREELQIFVRRFGLLNAASCEECCGQRVSLVQSHVLSVIRSRGNPSIQEIADELGIELTTFSRQVKRMEAKGLVSRRVSEQDRRVSLLALTEEGSRVLEQIDRYMAEKIRRIFSAMSPFEQDVVTQSLKVLNEAMNGASRCNEIGCNCQATEGA